MESWKITLGQMEKVNVIESGQVSLTTLSDLFLLASFKEHWNLMNGIGDNELLFSSFGHYKSRLFDLIIHDTSLTNVVNSKQY